MPPATLKHTFFIRPTLLVARRLLGQRLVLREPSGRRLAGLIIETEAYIGQDDLGCHAHHGRTDRNAVMWGKPGCAYVYFTYGMHWMLNIVTEPAGMPAAVLLRALHPTEGLELIRRRRAGQSPATWTNGPAKLCQAFKIDRRLNGYDLCQPEARLRVERRRRVPDWAVSTGPRVGLNSVPEPWHSMPWRFCLMADYAATIAMEELS
jgi:DNA-3-methyladenine glycosylase